MTKATTRHNYTKRPNTPVPPTPKISIVTPSLNQAIFLEETIQSVLNQGYPNLEYVVIDGGSTDSSVGIIKKYEKQLLYWVSEKDRGHGDALNKGFSQTSGDIMAWINSDDKYTPWSFKVVAEIFSSFPHVNWIVGYNSTWNSSGAMVRFKRRPKNVFDFLLGNYAWVQQESVFWRRSLWEKSGGYINEDYEFMVDGELWTRFFLHDELYSVDCILGGYRVHSANRAKHHYDRCLREMERAIAVMKEKYPQESLKIYSKINAVNQLRKAFRPLEYLMTVNLCRKLLLRSAFKSAAYKNIAFQDGRWIERKLPFSM